MSRPEKKRIVKQPPLYCGFKPVGMPIRTLSEVNFSLDEYEAIRLADHLDMEHSEAAIEMEISRPTFSRLIERARKKIAEFIIEGKYLQIDGGNIHFRGNIIKCNSCGHMFNITFEKNITKCPACDSTNLIDMAGNFGHGRCCRNKKNRKIGETK